MAGTNTSNPEINAKPDPALWNPTNTVQDNPTVTQKGVYKTLSYPENLGTDRYPYFMMFYINASSKSALAKSGATVAQQPQSRAPGQAVSTVGANLQAGLAGAAASLQSTQTDSNIVNFVANKAGQATASLAEYVPTKKRLNIAMALPMPNDVSFSHQANYNLAGSGVLGTLLKTFTSEGALAAGKAALEQELTQTAPNFAISSLADLAGTVGLNDSSSQDLIAIKNKILGIAQNERKEQVFKSMEPRQFQFSWLLIPRTEKESNIINDIIKFFKYNQYPEIPASSNGLNVIIPNEVDVEFHFMDGEIKNGVAKISTCVIDSVHVNYTPLGKFIAFDGTENPVGIQFSIVLKEVEPLTRTQIALGY